MAENKIFANTTMTQYPINTESSLKEKFEWALKQRDNSDKKAKDLQCDLDDAHDKIKYQTDRAETWKKAYEKERRRK
jgi:hypothetical protein